MNERQPMNTSNPTQYTEATVEVMPTVAIEAQERAAIDIQIATAKRYPRDLATVKRDMLSLATLDQETAESCFYTLRRKDRNEPGGYKIIQGPSARLAEIAINAFGHIHAATRTVGNDGKQVTVQGICHDLQKNVRIGTEVKRRITTKEGHTFSEDMQVVTTNAAQSIALRNAAFKVIPMALIKPVYEQAKKVAVGDAKTLATRREAVVKRLEELGAKRELIFSTLGIKGIDAIDLEKLELLIGIGTAIKDGDTTIDESFPPVTSPKIDAPSFITEPPPKTAPLPGEGEPEPPKRKPTQAAIEHAEKHPDVTAHLDDSRVLDYIEERIKRDGVSDDQVTAHLRNTKLAKKDQHWPDLSNSKLRTLANNWDKEIETIRKIQV